jgi:prevent-host-death family protein
MYITVFFRMHRKYSIAEARAQLLSLVDAVSGGRPVELTRRGQPVAVLLSIQTFARLREERTDFRHAYEAFTSRYSLAEIGWEPNEIVSPRDREGGRRVAL